MHTTTKAEAVYEFLKARIIAGELLPGARIKTTEVSRDYGVSETPVREALQRLEAEGMVSLQPNAGARVAEPNLEKLVELAVIRNELECLAARLAAKRITPACCEELNDLVDRMEEAIAQQQPMEYAALNKEFHHRVCLASGNNELVGMLENLWVRTEHWSAIFPRSPTQLMVRSNREHRRLVQALRKGDAATAQWLVRKQKEAALRAYLKIREQRPEVAADPET